MKANQNIPNTRQNILKPAKTNPNVPQPANTIKTTQEKTKHSKTPPKHSENQPKHHKNKSKPTKQ